MDKKMKYKIYVNYPNNYIIYNYHMSSKILNQNRINKNEDKFDIERMIIEFNPCLQLLYGKKNRYELYSNKQKNEYSNFNICKYCQIYPSYEEI